LDEKYVEMKIDGKNITVKEGTTILEAAKQNGINIPSLCYLEGLTSFGGCRLCLVEVKGASRPMESL
jgi:NADH dehydrogenase/NADH:ubiquinone oxidoreductase subunit G